MSKQEKRNEFAFSRNGTRTVAGAGPLPAIAGERLGEQQKRNRERIVPWIFSIDQAAHYECN